MMKSLLSALAVIIGMVSICAAQQTANISIIDHNIHSGGQPEAAADHIAELLELTPQKVIVTLQEANYARQYFTLPYTGWHNIWPSSPHEGRSNPIFVRDAAATMLASWKLEMEQSWTHDQPKDPRVYTAVKCQLVASPWVQFHVIDVHFPTVRTGNGPARQESVDRLIAESQAMPVLPLIIVGDFNMDEDEARTRIANPIGGRIYSNASVDHIIVRDGQSIKIPDDVTVTRMGLYISDHPALRYRLNFNEVVQTSAVADWTLY